MLIKRLAKSFFQHGFAGHSTSAGSSSQVRPFFKKQDISITVLQESQCTSLFFLNATFDWQVICLLNVCV